MYFSLERRHNATFHPHGILRHHWIVNVYFLVYFFAYTQSPFIRTTSIRLDAEILGKFKTWALGSSNLRTTSKNLRTTRAQIFKAKNGKKWKPCQFSVNSVDLELWHLKLSLYMKCSAKITLFMQIYSLKFFLFFLEKFKNPPAFKLEELSTSERLNLKNF